MIPEGTDNSRRSATPSTLPSDAERHGNHARRNPAGVGIVISSLGVELQAGFGEFWEVLFKGQTVAFSIENHEYCRCNKENQNGDGNDYLSFHGAAGPGA